MKQIEDAFKDFTNRENVAIVLINQFVSDISTHNRLKECTLEQPAHCCCCRVLVGLQSKPLQLNVEGHLHFADCQSDSASNGQFRVANACCPRNSQQRPAIRPYEGVLAEKLYHKAIFATSSHC